MTTIREVNERVLHASCCWIWATGGATLAGTVWGVDPAQVIVVDTTPHTLTQLSLPPVLARAATTGNIDLTLALTSTSSPHFLNAGDLVVYSGGTNDTYSAPYTVTAVTSSTTATLINAGALAVATDGKDSSGGTILSDSSGLRIAHRDPLTPEAGASLTGYDLFFQGDQLGNSICALKADNGGNVKAFEFFNIDVNGYRYSLQDPMVLPISGHSNTRWATSS